MKAIYIDSIGRTVRLVTLSGWDDIHKYIAMIETAGYLSTGDIVFCEMFAREDGGAHNTGHGFVMRINGLSRLIPGVGLVSRIDNMSDDGELADVIVDPDRLDVRFIC